MAELIDKNELETAMTEDWFLENLAAQDGKSAIKKDIENRIDNVPTTTEAEIRAKAIEEFAKRMKELYKIDEKTVFGWNRKIDEIAEQLKESE